MRITRTLMLGAAAVAALAVAYEPAAAEGFFQKLFGFGRARQMDSRPMPPPTFRFGYGGGERYDDRVYGDQPYGNGGFPEDFGTYRTLCVRTCDGFYFPIGDGVRRERLYADARACTQRCDGEARLYYYPTNGGSVETMVDMAGKPYAELPNAFRYRKTLVDGCTCKPAPWSAEAAARHQGYAAEQSEQMATRGDGQRLAGPPGLQADGGIEGYLQRESDGPQQTPWDGRVRRY